MSIPNIGVLALQGAYQAHADMLMASGAEAILVRRPSQLTGLDAIVIPGGESTTMSKLLDSSGLGGALGGLIESGLPTLGTCAGMILLATRIIDGRSDQHSFAAIDIDVQRNGYGRQLESFETELDVAGFVAPMRGVFIRGPKVTRVGDGVECLASYADVPVLLAEGSVTVASFHPELSGDRRLHQMFIRSI